MAQFPFGKRDSTPPTTPPVTPRDETVPRAQERVRRQPGHHRAFSADINPREKSARVEPPQKKKERVHNTELIEEFVTWLKGEEGTRPIEALIDQLAQRFNLDMIEKLIPKINQFTPKDIKAALGRVSQTDTGTPKSRDLYMFSLGALKTRENALPAAKAEKPEPSSGGVSKPSKEPTMVEKRVLAIEANIVASKPPQDLKANIVASKSPQVFKADGERVIREYLTAVAKGDEDSTTRLAEQLDVITDQLMEKLDCRPHKLLEDIRSWINLGLENCKREEKIAIYQHSSDHLHSKKGLIHGAREYLLGKLEEEVEEELAEDFISAVWGGETNEVEKAAKNLQKYCLNARLGGATEADRKAKIKRILEAHLREHALTPPKRTALVTSLRAAKLSRSSELYAPKILGDLIKPQRKGLKLPSLNISSPIKLPGSPRSPRTPSASSGPTEKSLTGASIVSPAPVTKDDLASAQSYLEAVLNKDADAADLGSKLELRIYGASGENRWRAISTFEVLFTRCFEARSSEALVRLRRRLPLHSSSLLLTGLNTALEAALSTITSRDRKELERRISDEEALTDLEEKGRVEQRLI